MAVFDYRQAEELRTVLGHHQVRYLFIVKSAAIILGATSFRSHGLHAGTQSTPVQRFRR